MAVARRLHALRAGIDRFGVEFLVQRELLDQRFAQLGVVIDDQDFAGVGHERLRGRNPSMPLREVEHSGDKAQAPAAIDSIRERHRDRGVTSCMTATTLEPCTCAPRPAPARAACSSPGRWPFRWRSAAAASWPTSAKATAGPRAAGSVWCGCGGAPTAEPGPQPRSPPAGSGRSDAWCEDPADRHYNRHIEIPAGDPATGSGATIISMISLSKSATTRARAWPGGAARCSSTSPGRASRRPPAASR